MSRTTGSELRTHLMFLVPHLEHPRIVELRRRWDPAMAAGVPPHITVAYPEEHQRQLELLVERAAEVAVITPPFPLELGPVAAHDGGAGGVFVAVADPTGSWQDLRKRILTPPFDALPLEPHLTLVHPRTSDRGEEAWRALRGTTLNGSITARHLMVTTTHPTSGLRIARRFPLGSALDDG